MDNLEDKILKDIKTGQLKLKSKYIFLAEKLGLRSAAILTVVITIVILGLLFWYLKATESFTYLSFGSEGFLTFLQSFPYGLVVVFTLFIVLAGYIIKKTELTTKIQFKYVAVVLILLSVVGSTTFAFGVSGSSLEKKQIEFAGAKFVKPLFGPGFDSRDKNITGAIVKVGDGYLLVEGPRGTTYLDVKKATVKGKTELHEGLFVVAAGKMDKEVFVVDFLSAKPTTSMPFLRHGFEENQDSSRHVIRRHGFIPSEINEQTNTCIKQCYELGMPVRDCVLSKCLKEVK